MPVLLHRTESKRGACAAWFSSGQTDIPEIHPEIPHGGISKKLNVLFIPSSGIFLLEDRENSTVQCCPHTVEQSIIVKWFGKELYRSSPQGLHSHLLVTLRCDEDDGNSEVISV
jgi:hypothetical protein